MGGRESRLVVVSVGGEGGPGRRRSTASGVVVMWERIIVWECTTGAIIRGEPERAPNTRVTYGEFAVPMYVCIYVCM